MKYLILLALILTHSYCRGQIDSVDYSANINMQVNLMGDLLIKKDYTNFVNYTYPKIVELMGGREKMILKMEEGTKEMETQGIKFQKVTFDEPSKIIVLDSELQCTIIETIELKVPNGKLVSISALIAISLDNGLNWYFIDTSTNDLATMKKKLPNLSDDLFIPPKTQPIFYKD